jgi:hypothetical protein
MTSNGKVIQSLNLTHKKLIFWKIIFSIYFNINKVTFIFLRIEYFIMYSLLLILFHIFMSLTRIESLENAVVSYQKLH